MLRQVASRFDFADGRHVDQVQQVNYDGWDQKWDQWINTDEKRIALLGTRAPVPQILETTIVVGDVCCCVRWPDSGHVTIDGRKPELSQKMCLGDASIQFHLAQHADILCMESTEKSASTTTTTDGQVVYDTEVRSRLMAVRTHKPLQGGEAAIRSMCFLRMVAPGTVAVMNQETDAAHFVISSYS